jgi:hypothetical protein
VFLADQLFRTWSEHSLIPNFFGLELMQVSTDRIARGCAEASLGYAAAATAAYTELAYRAFDFWSTALSGLVDQPQDDAGTAAAEPMATSEAEPPFGLSMVDWCPFPWLDPRRYDAVKNLDAASHPMAAMFAMAGFAPLRGSPASWGMAHLLIESGVPRTVAWPAAEANAAALDVADAATAGVRQIMANYHTENGFAAAARPITPSAFASMFLLGAASYTPFASDVWRAFG